RYVDRYSARNWYRCLYCGIRFAEGEEFFETGDRDVGGRAFGCYRFLGYCGGKPGYRELGGLIHRTQRFKSCYSIGGYGAVDNYYNRRRCDSCGAANLKGSELCGRSHELADAA